MILYFGAVFGLSVSDCLISMLYVLFAEREMSADYRRLYEAYYNRSAHDLDLGAAANISNQTTTPAFTLEPLNLTAVMLDVAPVISIVHEPFMHPVCRPQTCLGCPRSLPTDSMITPLTPTVAIWVQL